MKRQTPKKSDSRGKGASRKGKGGDDIPLEFDRGWQELEAQHDRVKMDFTSLAAQLGIGTKSKSAY